MPKHVAACRSRRAAGLVLAWTVLNAGCGTEPTAPSAVPSGRIDLAQPWTSAAPADVGMDAGALEAAAARGHSIPRFRSLLVARRGRLVLERYFGGSAADTPFDVRSVTKSVVSALTGIAIQEGSLRGLDAPVSPFLDSSYRLDPADTGVTVRHLLTMTSGYEWDDDVDYNRWIVSGDHVQYLLDRPLAHPPGATFTYNSAAVHVLGVALERATGTPLPQYARDRLLGPLGIQDAAWESLDHGTVNGGSGLDLRGRDLLKLGQLYLQRGFSGDRSLVPEAWVEATTEPQFAWRDDYGAERRATYGMLWWVSDAAPPAYFAWGYGGQFVYVVPSKDLVVVTTTEWRRLTETTPLALAEQILGLIVEDIVPAAN